MLKDTINSILYEINITISIMEEKEINKKTAIEYLELDKLKTDFEKYLKCIEEKENEEKENDITINEK